MLGSHQMRRTAPFAVDYSGDVFPLISIPLLNLHLLAIANKLLNSMFGVNPELDGLSPCIDILFWVN